MCTKHSAELHLIFICKFMFWHNKSHIASDIRTFSWVFSTNCQIMYQYTFSSTFHCHFSSMHNNTGRADTLSRISALSASTNQAYWRSIVELYLSLYVDPLILIVACNVLRYLDIMLDHLSLHSQGDMQNLLPPEGCNRYQWLPWFI